MSSLRTVIYLVTLVPTLVSARTWNVYEDGSGDAPTIQAAADSSAPGDSILVGPGTYAEAITLPHDLTLKGTAGPSLTTVDAENARPLCLDTGRGVTQLLIEGLTFQGTANGYGFACHSAAVTVGGSVEVRDCHFYGNAGFGNGAALVAYGDLRIVDSVFSLNWSGAGGPHCSPFPDPTCAVACIVLAGNGALEIEGCVFQENSACHLIDAYGGRIVGNVFVRNDGSPVRGLGGLFRSFPDVVEGNLFVENLGPLFPEHGEVESHPSVS